MTAAVEYLTRYWIKNNPAASVGILADVFECIDDSDRYPIRSIEQIDGRLLVPMERFVARQWFSRWQERHNVLWDGEHLPRFITDQIPDVVAEARRDAEDERRHVELESMA